ncbi:MAG: ribonuclease P protein component, partial [Chloroflexota bacterium]|nr:ribonuclease P protein component [Chloroflexota bacterium]
MTREAFPKSLRLRRRADFAALRERGASYAHPYLVLRAAPNALPHSRFAFAVSKRVAKHAVARNLLRRRMREVARRSDLRGGWDALFIARPACAGADFADVRKAMRSVGRR